MDPGSRHRHRGYFMKRSAGNPGAAGLFGTSDLRGLAEFVVYI